jgi:hypothetical protein
MTEPKLVTQKAYADYLGISRQAVNKMVRAGRIPSEHGRIDPVAADAALAPADSATGNETLAGALLRKELALAGLRELELSMKSGKYVDVEYASEMVTQLSMILRSIVLQMPTRAVQAISDEAVKRPVFAAATRVRNDILRQLGGATDHAPDAKLCAACTAKVLKVADKYVFPGEAFPKGLRNPAGK